MPARFIRITSFALAVFITTSTGSNALDPAAFSTLGCDSTLTVSETQFRRVIRNFTSHTTLEIDGPEWNDTLIVDCHISGVDGDGITIKNVRNLTIKGCLIEDVSGSAIRLRSTGSSQNVVLFDNHIDGAGEDGISAAKRERDGVDHTHLVIAKNFVRNTGLRGRRGLQHAIYSQASDAVIFGNTIRAKREGNAISVRSSGLVACNDIAGVSRDGKPGIRYYADHTAGPSDHLTIRDNMISGTSIAVEIRDPPSRYRKRTQYLVHRFSIFGNRTSADTPVYIHDFWTKNSAFDVFMDDNLHVEVLNRAKKE